MIEEKMLIPNSQDTLSEEQKIEYLFLNLDTPKLTEFVFDLINSNKSRYHKYFKKHFLLLINRLGSNFTFLMLCLKKLGKNIFLNNFAFVDINLNNKTKCHFYPLLFTKDSKIKEYISSYPIASQLFDASDKKHSFDFSRDILYPMIHSSIEEYLEYSLKKVFEGKELNIEFLTTSRSGLYIFKINEYVLKIGKIWSRDPIPMCDSINELILRKSINSPRGSYYIDLSPYGNIACITREEIELVKDEIFSAGILYCDPVDPIENFAEINFEVPKDIYKDTDGILVYRKVPEKLTDRNIKLIDHDWLKLED